MDLRLDRLGCVEWIQSALDRDLWRDLVNTVMNLWVLVPWSGLISYEYLACLLWMSRVASCS
jgi:hypothetical protein